MFGRTERAPLRQLALGPGFGVAGVKEVLENCKLRFQYLLTNEPSPRRRRADGRRQDPRLDAGPHGVRSARARQSLILASPLNPYSSENLNIYIKRREQFRKFAASVPAELGVEYFEAGANARFLATVGSVRARVSQDLRAALLGRDTLRVHVVERRGEPAVPRTADAAGQTGLPVLYNTSFNLFGDPLVCTPRDAVRSFYSPESTPDRGNFCLQK